MAAAGGDEAPPPVAQSGGGDDEWPEDEETGDSGLSLALEIAPTTSIVDSQCDCKVMVAIQVPEGETDIKPLERTKSGRVVRAATDVCCVVDISGSMSSKATYEVDGVQKDDGLIYLDIVKHAVKSVMHTLKAQDRFALVSFDNEAETVFPMASMDTSGRDTAVSALEALKPRGRTNIWAGILAAMEALRVPAGDAGWRQKTILLLTDGQPNVLPPNGLIPELRSYKESHPDFNFQLNTFGFGYNLDSQMLLDLAMEGQGTFSFIPDAVIVGTCFVNCISNVLSTQTQNATLHLTAQGGAEFTGAVVGVPDHMVTDASWGRVVSLGPLQFGNTREVVVPMRIPSGTTPYLEATIVYPGPDGAERRVSLQSANRVGSSTALVAAARSEMADVGYEAVAHAENDREAEAKKAVADLVSHISEFEATLGETSVPLSGLKADVSGRMTKGLDGKERFNRWGKHYLRALTRAHQLQLCTNFMDRGLQGYGGTLFQALRDEGDKIFVTLPPPKPQSTPASARRPSASTGGSGSSAAPAAAASPDMNTYYAGSGGG